MLCLLIAYVAFMGYHASKVSLGFERRVNVRSEDPIMIQFKEYQRIFGENNHVLLIGIEKEKLRVLENFRAFQQLCHTLQTHRYVKSVISLPNTIQLQKQTHSFTTKKIFEPPANSQDILDRQFDTLQQMKMYDGMLYSGTAAILMITIEPKPFLTPQREIVLGEILEKVKNFENETQIPLRYSGFPYLHQAVLDILELELLTFVGMVFLFTFILLWIIFRSFSLVIPSILLAGILQITVFGVTSLLGYKITVLLSVISPAVIIIGMTNYVYITNRYKQLYPQHKDKKKALIAVLEQLGKVILVTNLTTAIGSAVLGIAQVQALQEFGAISSISIGLIFVITMSFIPVYFSFTKAPKPFTQTNLLYHMMDKILDKVYRLIAKNPRNILILSAIIILATLYAITFITFNARITEDIPSKHHAKEDLYYFQDNFKGILPLEVVIDTQKENGLLEEEALRLAEQLSTGLDSFPELHVSLSPISLVKMARMTYYNGNPAFYEVPNKRDYPQVMRYVRSFITTDSTQRWYSPYVDSTRQFARISIWAKDIGSSKLERLYTKMQKYIDHVLAKTPIKAFVTGETLLFARDHSFLIQSFAQSMTIAFLLIGLIMAFTLSRLKIIGISLLANIIPLLMTLGIMSLVGIPLKPSTVIVFSISFGIVVDHSIHFLIEYNYVLKQVCRPLYALRVTFQRIGSSMIYTAITLSGGFGILAFSQFGGTRALGILVSLTLAWGLLTNIFILPCLLLAIEKKFVEEKKRVETDE